MDFYKNLQNQTDTINDVAANLRRLGRAFSIVGNYDVAEQLHEAARDLNESSATLITAYSKEISSELKRSQAEVGNLLSLVANKVS